MRAIAALLASGRLKTVASGLENIPAQGPALIVARHYHHLYDGLALFGALPRPFHIVVTIDWVRNRRMKWLMQVVNRIARWPMLIRADALARSGRSSRLFSPVDVLRYQRSALREAAHLLVKNRIVVIFPEGYPNIDPAYTPKKYPDEFLRFKPGLLSILKIAERNNIKIPIIPTGICYRVGPCSIAYLKFGEPISSDRFSESVELIQVLEQRVKELSINRTDGSDPVRTVVS
jgi:putative membrane protein